MTERVETIQSARREEGGCHTDLLAGFAEAIPVPVVLLTPDTRVRYANTAFVRTLGISAEHYLHRKLPNHWLREPRESLPQLRELLHEVGRSEGDPEPIRLSLRSSDGAEIPTEVHARSWPGCPDGLSSLIVVTFSDVGQDVTELRRVQEELRHSEERLKIIFECAPDAYYLCDLKGHFVDGNRAAEEMVGCRREELIGKSFLKLNLLPASQIPKAASALIRNAMGRPTGPDEFTLNRRDGAQRAVEISTYPVRIRGQVLVLGIARDITERKRAQEELRDSEAKYRALHESSRDGCVATDLDGKILECNTAFQEMVGYTADELGQLTYEDITPPRWHDREAKIVAEQVFTRGYSDLYEKEYIHKDGTVFPIELRLYLQKNRAGDPIGLWAVVRNISERQRAQEEILREKAFSESLINSLPGVFYMLDETGKYVWWNQNLEDATECTAAEMPNIHPLELFQGEDREKVRERIARAFAEGRVAVEAELVSKSGWRTPYYFTGVRVVKDGAPYLVGLGIDITERQKARDVLEKLNDDLEATVQELERSNQELQDFAHITAHDLKAPLRGIATLADWFARDYAEQVDEPGRETLHLLQSRVGRMTHLIDGILRYSEIGQGQQCIEMLDTHTLLEEVIEQIAPPDHIEICIEGCLPRVPGERTRLTQVFQNLVSNAVKYIDKPRGRIRISARDEGDVCQFTVTDNGPGIEARHFARIFQMFQTLSGSEHCDSTGLGLAVVKKIVDTYGGRIWLESEIGVGSSFHFTLPRDRHAETPKED